MGVANGVDAAIPLPWLRQEHWVRMSLEGRVYVLEVFDVYRPEGSVLSWR